MVPYLVDPDTEHQSDYRCCEIVRCAAASAALDGRELDDGWLTTLHQVIMKERTVEDVVAEVIQRAAGDV